MAHLSPTPVDTLVQTLFVLVAHNASQNYNLWTQFFYNNTYSALAVIDGPLCSQHCPSVGQATIVNDREFIIRMLYKDSY